MMMIKPLIFFLIFYMFPLFTYSAVYFAGIYTTSFYDCGPIIAFSKPFIEPYRLYARNAFLNTIKNHEDIFKEKEE